MSKPQLNNPPLIEALFEMQWGRDGEGDPSYPLIVGRLYETLFKGKYPEQEDLPVSEMPARVTMHLVRHRFRKAKNGWPLVQLGAGVLTYNETENYEWGTFKNNVIEVVNNFYKFYPGPTPVAPNSYLLRYINAIEYDASVNLQEFIASHLKISQNLPDALFAGLPIEKKPLNLDMHFSFQSKKPEGLLDIFLSQGFKQGKPAIILDLNLRSTSISEMPTNFEDWITSGHTIIEDWFFKMIEGPLREKFNGNRK